MLKVERGRRLERVQGTEENMIWIRVFKGYWEKCKDHDGYKDLRTRWEKERGRGR